MAVTAFVGYLATSGETGGYPGAIREFLVNLALFVFVTIVAVLM